MSVVRHYVMIAAQGKAGSLAAALTALAVKVRVIDGCEGVEVMQDQSTPEYLVFIERWASVEAHKAGGQALGREALLDVMSAVAEPPQARYLEILSET